MKCRQCGATVEHDCPNATATAARMSEIARMRNPKKFKRTMAKARKARKPRPKRNQTEVICDECEQPVGKALLQGTIPKWQLDDIAAAMIKLHKETFHAPAEAQSD